MKKYNNILTFEFLKKASEEELSNIQIEEITGINRSTIQEYRDELNLISRRSFQYRKAMQLRKEPIFKDLVGLIVGTILGDGYLSSYSNQSNTSALQVTHCLRQKKYVLLKYLLLKQICISEPRKIINRIHNINKDFINYRLDTICHPDLRKLRDIIYINGKKTITKEVLNLLTIPGFALWYMDDGSYANYRYILCTHCFSLEENKLIREHFFKKLNIKTTILVQRNKFGKKYYYLHFAKDTVQTFEKLVAPFIIPCLQYKINSKAFVKYLGSSETIHRTSLWNCFLKDDDIVRAL